MNSNQRSEGNNQTDNGGNEKSVSSYRGGTVQKDNINPEAAQYAQSGTLGAPEQHSGQRLQQDDQSGSQRQQTIGQQQQGPASQMGQQSTDRNGSQTGSQQEGQAAQRESNDAAGGYPRSPGGSHLAADKKMDDDTGMSNTVNTQSADDIDDGTKQEHQSNVGRRSDMTPD